MNYSGRLGIIQRVLPTYRANFFSLLGEACQNGLGIFAGKARQAESIVSTQSIAGVKLFEAHNLHFFEGPLYGCWQQGLTTWLRKWQPDVLIVEANPRYLSTPLAIHWMHARNKSVIGWGLGAPNHIGGLAAFTNLTRKHFLQQFEAIITYSKTGAQEYARLGLNPESLYVANNAVSPRPSTPIPVRPDRFATKPNVLFVGRLQARKRIDNLLNACATLPEALQPELIIVGEGPAREELEAQAKQIYPSAQFTGAKFGAELNAHFIKADLFVLPGTGGLAIQQAMSFGLPVIAAEADGTQDDLIRQSNGWQIPADNLDALKQTLELALSEPARLRQMGAESYRIVCEEINLEKMVSIFLNAIEYAQTRIII
ncbi:MAG: glycosyltransferase [Anaerolineaceae bacterium]|nr:glycosyltransferase [Anaerolineaceae bacterium]